MELREEELTEEQLQLMTEFHSKNKTSRFAPSWVQSVVSHGHACSHSWRFDVFHNWWYEEQSRR